jgi:hypothetical protein
MAVIVSSDTNFTKTVKNAYWNKRFVEVLESLRLLRDLGDPAQLPEGEGKTMRWLLFANSATALATLVLAEGTDEAEQAELGVTELDAALTEYGGWFKIANLAERVTLSGTMQQYVDRTAYQASLALDEVLTGTSADTPTTGLLSGTTAHDAGASASASAFKSVSQKLDAIDALSHPKAGGGARFVAVVSTEQFYDTIGEGEPTFYQIAAAAQNAQAGANALSGRRVGVYDVELRVSTNIKRDTLPSPQDDLGFVFSGNSFGITSLDNPQADPQVIIKPSSQGGLTSVLNMWGAIGWKANFGFKVFAANRIYVFKSDATGVA